MTSNNSNWPDTESLESLTDSHTEEELEKELAEAEKQLAELPADVTDIERAKIILTKVIALIGLNRKNETWSEARPLLDIFVENHMLEEAVQACDVLYQSNHLESTKALIHGVWLSVSFPMDPHLTVAMLSHIVDETPENSDGAALAAATAHYIVGIRAVDNDFENLNFFTTNLLANVANRHSHIDTQEGLNAWMEKLELNDPDVFLPRLGAVLNVIVNEKDWWFDRDALRARFPQ